MKDDWSRAYLDEVIRLNRLHHVCKDRGRHNLEPKVLEDGWLGGQRRTMVRCHECESWVPA